jgi:hypothetical protein
VPLARSGIDLRRATAPRALAETGGAPDDAGASSAGGRAAVSRWDCGSKERERANSIGWAHAGRWLRWQMQSEANGRLHGAVKHAMGEKVGRYF